MLLVRQLVDPLDDLLVVHVGSRPRSGPNDTTVPRVRTGPSAAPPARDDGLMSNLRELLTSTADRVADYRGSLAERRVAPVADLERLRAELGGPLPGGGAGARP